MREQLKFRIVVLEELPPVVTIGVDQILRTPLIHSSASLAIR